MSIYTPGKKVVCINDDFSAMPQNNMKAFRQLPVKDVIYTVREFDDPSLKLEEINNPTVTMNVGGILMDQEGAFHKNRFAPLLEDREEMTESLLEDISIEIEEEMLELL